MPRPLPERRAVGPGWNARVYAVVRQCPAGFVTTYGQVATLLGSPRVARHVGYALAGLGRTPPGEEPVPWHRVINSQGCISHRGDVPRASKQERLLKRESASRCAWVEPLQGRGACLGCCGRTTPRPHWPSTGVVGS